MTKFLKILLILSFASLVCFAQTRQGSTNQTVTNSAQTKPNSTTKNIVELNQRGAGKKIGTVTVTETANGTSISVEATGLKVDAGQVGLHLYEKNSPKPTKDESGNLVIGGGLGEDMGDLGSLTVNADGSVSQTIVGELEYSDIKGKSLVITDDVNSYADNTQLKAKNLYMSPYSNR